MSLLEPVVAVAIKQAKKKEPHPYDSGVALDLALYASSLSYLCGQTKNFSPVACLTYSLIISGWSISSKEISWLYWLAKVVVISLATRARIWPNLSMPIRPIIGVNNQPPRPHCIPNDLFKMVGD